VETPWTPKRQDNLGELSAIEWLGHVSDGLFKPLVEHADYDLVADINGTCDAVFVHVADGRRWYIPARALGGKSSISLGGPKSAEFEIERGRPFVSRSTFEAGQDSPRASG
jgi:hypothetical protein